MDRKLFKYFCLSFGNILNTYVDLFFIAIFSDLPFNATVQMVLVNYGDKETVHGHHHTIHLHGHDFVVIKTGLS